MQSVSKLALPLLKTIPVIKKVLHAQIPELIAEHPCQKQAYEAWNL